MSSAIKHLLLPSLFVISSVCNAQTVSNEILNGTKWEVPQTNPDVSVIMSYTKKTITEILKSKKTNNTSERSYRYYFTDEYPTKFDKKKVGKPNSGKYFCMLMLENQILENTSVC